MGTFRVRTPDRKVAPHMDGMIITYVDGHAKWMKADAFLAKCPTANDFQPSINNVPGGMAWTIGNEPMRWRGDWALWGLYGEMATLP